MKHTLSHFNWKHRTASESLSSGGVFILISLGAWGVSGCSDTFMASSVKDTSTAAMELAATADEAGNYSAAMDPSANTTQLLKASTGAVAGSAIAMPPGSLSIAVSITIGQGETLATSEMSQQLGMTDNAASAAGPAVSFMPSESVEASNPFTLSIPISSSSSLALNEVKPLSKDLTVVVYKWMKVENGTITYAMGMLPPNEITLGTKSVQFQTTKFGTFQLATLQQPIKERVNKPTMEPPVMKADAGNPLVGVWSGCREGESMTPPENTSGGGGSTDPGPPVVPGFGGPAVGGACQALQSGPSSPFEIAVKFNEITAGTMTGPPPQFTLIRKSGDLLRKGTTQYNASWEGDDKMSVALPPQSPRDIGENEKIAIVAPPQCYFKENGVAGSETRVLNYSNWKYGQNNTAKLDFSNYSTVYSVSFDAEMNAGSAYQSVVRDGDLIEVTSGLGGDVTLTSGHTGPLHLKYNGAINSYQLGIISGGYFSTMGFTLASGSGLRSISVKRVPIIQTVDNGQFSLNSYFGGLFGVQESVFIGAAFSNQPYFVVGKANSGTYPNTITEFSLNATASSVSADTDLDVASAEIYSNSCREANRATWILDCADANVASAPTLPQDIIDALAYDPNAAPPPPPPPADDDSNQGDGRDSRMVGVRPGAKVWERESMKFSANTYIHSSANFSAPNCTGKLISRTEDTGSYILGPKAADQSFPIDIKMVSGRVGIMDPDAMRWANQNPALNCGISDWVVAVPRDMRTLPGCKREFEDSSGPDSLKIEGGRMLFKDRDTNQWSTKNSLSRE